MKRAILFAAVAGLGLGAIVVAQTQEAARPGASAAPGTAVVKRTLNDVAFLTGAWSSSSEEMGYAEEHWSAAHGTSIMGMFRWCSPAGEPRMFEMLTITEEGGEVLLRMRHYSARLTAKEERDQPLTMRLSEVGAKKATFVAHKDAGDLAKVVYDAGVANGLKIEVVFSKDGVPPLVFEMKRLAAK